MDAPAYYDVHSAMNDHCLALIEPSYEGCEPPSYPCTSEHEYSGYEDLSYLPQWSDGSDGYASAYSSVNENSCGAL